MREGYRTLKHRLLPVRRLIRRVFIFVRVVVEVVFLLVRLVLMLPRALVVLLASTLGVLDRLLNAWEADIL